MNIGRIVEASSGQQFHVGGRRRPVMTGTTNPHLFRAYARYRAPLVAIPPEVDNSESSSAAQSDILGNNSRGNCTCAGALHLIEAWTACAQSPVVFHEQDAIVLYSHWCGYDPNDPSTDQGGDEVAIVQAWQSGGIDGKGSHAIAGSLTVDPNNVEETKQAIYEFGGLYLGGELADAWTQNPTDGMTWDLAPADPADGHCIVAVGYDNVGVLCNSWGLKVKLTWAAFAQFAAAPSGNCFVLLSKEWLVSSTQQCPAGLRWEQLVQDFDGFGGTVPV